MHMDAAYSRTWNSFHDRIIEFSVFTATNYSLGEITDGEWDVTHTRQKIDALNAKAMQTIGTTLSKRSTAMLMMNAFMKQVSITNLNMLYPYANWSDPRGEKFDKVYYYHTLGPEIPVSALETLVVLEIHVNYPPPGAFVPGTNITMWWTFE